jgi:hypothetical protein
MSMKRTRSVYGFPFFSPIFFPRSQWSKQVARGENATVTQTVRDAFRELQMGGNYEQFNLHLKDELGNGIGA